MHPVLARQRMRRQPPRTPCPCGSARTAPLSIPSLPQRSRRRLTKRRRSSHDRTEVGPNQAWRPHWGQVRRPRPGDRPTEHGPETTLYDISRTSIQRAYSWCATSHRTASSSSGSQTTRVAPLVRRRSSLSRQTIAFVGGPGATRLLLWRHSASAVWVGRHYRWSRRAATRPSGSCVAESVRRRLPFRAVRRSISWLLLAHCGSRVSYVRRPTGDARTYARSGYWE